MTRHLALILGSCALLLVACVTSDHAEVQGDSESNLITVPGRGRLSLTVATKQGTVGIPAHVTAKCGGLNGQDNLAGDGDAEGILFPLIRPEDCVVVVTVKAGDAGKDTVIEVKHPGKANAETVATGSGGGYAVTATFGEPVL